MLSRISVIGKVGFVPALDFISAGAVGFSLAFPLALAFSFAINPSAECV
jgi:hypothetical protein